MRVSGMQRHTQVCFIFISSPGRYAAWTVGMYAKTHTLLHAYDCWKGVLPTQSQTRGVEMGGKKKPTSDQQRKQVVAEKTRRQVSIR